MNRYTTTGFVLALLLPALPSVSGCSAEDEPRTVKIMSTAPEHEASTGLRQEFAVLVEDSLKRPRELTVSVGFDQGGRYPCRFEVVERNTVDKTSKEELFRCDVDTAAIPSGFRKATFSIEGAGTKTVKKSVNFFHIAVKPELERATAKLGEAGAEVKWRVNTMHHPFEVQIWRRGVRLASSYSAEGTLVLNLPNLAGDTLTLRAFDPVGNEAAVELVVK